MRDTAGLSVCFCFLSYDESSSFLLALAADRPRGLVSLFLCFLVSVFFLGGHSVVLLLFYLVLLFLTSTSLYTSKLEQMVWFWFFTWSKQT